MASTIGLTNLMQALSNALMPSSYQGVVGDGSTANAVVDRVGGFSAGQWGSYGIQFSRDTETVALRGVWQKIDTNDGDTLTLSGALPAEPAAGDTYNIRPFGSQLQNLTQIGGTAQTGGDWTPQILGVAQDGTDADGVAPPAGATGIRGWLSGLYSLFNAGTARVLLGGRSTEVVQETSAETNVQSLAFNIQYLALLINDSTTVSLLFSFDGATWKTLKPGEYVSDLAVVATNLHVKTTASTAPFRAWGWR